MSNKHRKNMSFFSFGCLARLQSKDRVQKCYWNSNTGFVSAELDVKCWVCHWGQCEFLHLHWLHAGVRRPGWPVPGMATVSCVNLRKHWKFNVLGEVRREDVREWPRKACRHRDKRTTGGWSNEGEGGGAGPYSLCIQSITLPQSTCAAKLRECVYWLYKTCLSSLLES